MNEGSKLIDDLKVAYADAMWVWAEVETGLFSIYTSAIDPNIVNVDFDDAVTRKEWHALHAAFFAINSFEMRLVMTNAAAKVAWAGHDYLNLWSEIFELCLKENKRRGKIAHLTGSIFEAPDGGKVDIAVLHQPSGHTKFPANYGKAKSEGHNAETLKQYSKDWEALLLKMEDLSHLAINLPLRTQSAPQVAGPDHRPQKRGDPNHEELG